MNRTTGAYTHQPVKTFGIIISLAEGGSIQTTAEAHTARLALGRTFGELRREGFEPRADKAVLFCKSADQMTEDERFQWDMASDADHARAQRRADQNRPAWGQLHQF